MNLRFVFVDSLPKTAIRVFSKPYIAGDSMQAALDKAAELADAGIAATIDILGEDAATGQDVDHYVALYVRLIESAAHDARLQALPPGRKPSVSLKPSSFVVAPKDNDGMVIDPGGIDRTACAQAIGRVIESASKHGIRATIDMENHQWTDLTLSIHAELFARYGRTVGTVLQSRLFRTVTDIDQLPSGSRIRLCTGIYSESAEIALQQPAEIKSRMLSLARALFAKDVFVEFATHDQGLIERFFNEVVLTAAIGPSRFETQTLMGVPRAALIRSLTSGSYFEGIDDTGRASSALRRGIVHRLYVPFAENWDRAIAYARRRLRHSPNIFWTGLVNAPRVLYYAMRGR